MGPRKSLNAYLSEIRHRPFEWGRHDCLIFTNEAWRRMYGQPWCYDWLGRHMKGERPVTKKQFADMIEEEFGTRDINEAISTRLTPIDYTPPLGALVTTYRKNRFVLDVALGISLGRKGVFLSDDGVLCLPIDKIQKAWLP